ncbi:MAG: hypothetical protein OJF47_003563 [Nitrospira sp.]|nr:MAG: hypothetical protein OJF47_003563 [Nitrospira sp.]
MEEWKGWCLLFDSNRISFKEKWSFLVELCKSCLVDSRNLG